MLFLVLTGCSVALWTLVYFVAGALQPSSVPQAKAHLWRQHSANLAHAIITSAQAVLVVSHGNPADGGEELTYDAMVFSTAATKRCV